MVGAPVAKEKSKGLSGNAAKALLNANMLFPAPKDRRWTDLWESQKPLVQRQSLSTKGKRGRDTTPWTSSPELLFDGSYGSEIDWDKELAEFRELPYPSYYLWPFHSLPGGWLSVAAAMNNRRAMEAIYSDCHPQKCFGVRAELARFVPLDARVVVDFGSGDGDGPAAVARRLPEARVVAVEASPFMIIVGRRQNRDVPNLVFRHALAEATDLEGSSADAITITLLFHECSDDGKAGIIREALRVLRPGGTLVFSDTPPADLQTYRGFLEPWRDQWLHFDVDTFLTKAGFVSIEAYERTPPVSEGGFQVRPTEQRLFTRVAKKPLQPSSRMWAFAQKPLQPPSRL